MKNLGCLLPYSSQNVTGNTASRKTLFFWPKKEFKNMLDFFLDLTLTVFMLLSEESLGGSKNPKWLNK